MVISSVVSAKQLAGYARCFRFRWRCVWSSGGTEAGDEEQAMSETPNQRAGGKGGIPLLFQIVRVWPALPQHDRWAESG